MLQSTGLQSVGHDLVTEQQQQQSLLYNVVLVSAVQRSESALCLRLPPLFWIFFPFRSLKCTE